MSLHSWVTKSSSGKGMYFYDQYLHIETEIATFTYNQCYGSHSMLLLSMIFII